VEGEESFQEGDSLTLSSTFNLHSTPQLSFILNGQYTHHWKDKEWNSDNTLTVEPSNSSGDEFNGGLTVSYKFSEQFTVQTQGDWRYYAEGDRIEERSGRPYESQRVRYAAGGGLSYTVNQSMAFSGAAQYFVMTQEPDFEREDKITYTGVNLELGVTLTY
jgi:hypothetical protein